MNARHSTNNTSRRGSAAKAAVLALGVLALVVVIVVVRAKRNTAPRHDAPLLNVEQPDTAAPEKTDDQTQSPDAAQAPVKITAYQLGPELTEVVSMISQQRFIEARAMLALYLKRQQKAAPTEFLYGLSYQKEKRYELARPYFESSIDIDPGYRPAWYFYGWCLYYLGEAEKSRAAFERHLTMDPLEGDSHYGIALIDMDENKLDDAQWHFEQAIELQQNNPRRVREVAKAHARLGDIYALRDDLVKAKEELVIATEMWPMHYEAQFKLGRVLYRLGEDEAAEAAMQRFEEYRQRSQGGAALPMETGEHDESEPDAQTEPAMDDGTPQ